MANTTFLNHVDTEKVDELLEQTKTNAEYFNSVTKRVTQEYSKTLDKLMGDITKIIDDRDIETSEIERYFLELSNVVYFMGSKLEQLGVFSDIADAAEKEVFNKAYLEYQLKDADKKNKTTVQETTSYAQGQSQYETVITNIYEHAYKLMKFKIDAAQTMISTLSKLLSKRMQDDMLASNSSLNRG